MRHVRCIDLALIWLYHLQGSSTRITPEQTQEMMILRPPSVDDDLVGRVQVTPPMLPQPPSPVEPHDPDVFEPIIASESKESSAADLSPSTIQQASASTQVKPPQRGFVPVHRTPAGSRTHSRNISGVSTDSSGALSEAAPKVDPSEETQRELQAYITELAHQSQQDIHDGQGHGLDTDIDALVFYLSLARVHWFGLL